ncbi:MAG TPA: ribosome maturation factor RimP, partial [Gammaproteobacteria bacterium]|nr:ribosome maturation factor RimP [Gammaproteobacteria bacterium]
LFTAEQFQRFIGYKVSVQTHTAVDNQRKFKGLLKSTTAKGIVLSPEGEDLTLAWNNIMRANVLPETIR